MEFQQKDVVQIINNSKCSLSEEQENDSYVWHTVRHQIIKVVLNEQEILCSGIALFVDTFGTEVLQLLCPILNNIKLDDFYYLDIPLTTIESLDVVPV